MYRREGIYEKKNGRKLWQRESLLPTRDEGKNRKKLKELNIRHSRHWLNRDDDDDDNNDDDDDEEEWMDVDCDTRVWVLGWKKARNERGENEFLFLI